MTLMTMISIYLVIGVACSLCFDIMMEWTGQTKETGPPTTFEISTFIKSISGNI